MTKAKLNAPIADMSFVTTNNQTLSFAKLQGKNIVLYFYPKDNTPGCTSESKDFRDHFNDFTKLDVVIFGISRDSLASHEKFKAKHCFPFELISDVDSKLCNYFDVIKPTLFFGKNIERLERSTFIIDKKGVLRQEWRKVKVAGHVGEILNAMSNLK